VKAYRPFLFRCSFLALAFASGPSGAGLLYYEPFDYPVAEDGLKYNGGFAANPSPGSGSDADIGAENLRYMDANGLALVSRGSHALIDGHEERTTVSNIAPVLRLPHQQPAGDAIWISFIGQQVAGTTTRFFNLGLRAADNTIQPADGDTNMDEIVAFGMPSGAAAQVWHVWDRSTGGNLWASAPSTCASTQCSFIVARIELNAVEGFKERYTFWVSPLLDRPPAEAEGWSFISNDSDFDVWSDLEQIRLAAGYTAGAASGWQVDEIRIADSVAEVMPFIPLSFDSMTTDPDTGVMQLQWQPAPGYLETMEWSPDLRQWFPQDLAMKLPPQGNASFQWFVPPGENRYLRLRRSY
jgi:hypothetical protein